MQKGGPERAKPLVVFLCSMNFVETFNRFSQKITLLPEADYSLSILFASSQLNHNAQTEDSRLIFLSDEQRSRVYTFQTYFQLNNRSSANMKKSILSINMLKVDMLG